MMILSAERLLDQQHNHNYRLTYRRSIGKAWEDERTLDKHAFTNNGRKHSWQKAETWLLTNQPAAPGAAVFSLSHQRDLTRKGTRPPHTAGTAN